MTFWRIRLYFYGGQTRLAKKGAALLCAIDSPVSESSVLCFPNPKRASRKDIFLPGDATLFRQAQCSAVDSVCKNKVNCARKLMEIKN
jgi:hypothetical protein